MSLFSALFTALYTLAGLWALIHLALCLLLPHTPRVELSYYPPPSDRSPILLTTTVLLLTVRTTRLNAGADALAAWFGRARRGGVRRAAKAMYTVGGALAAGGMLGALGLLGWTAVRLAGRGLGRWAVQGAAVNIARVWKRDELPATFATKRADSGIPIYAIIPGVTVPLSHIPLLVFALISSQIIHEVGHFITAALENVPVLSVGLSLSIVIPSAFVALSRGAVRELPVPARLRVASSGAFHNIVLYLIFSGITHAHIDRAFLGALGYRDVSAWGRVVSHVQPGSPLEGYLPLGSIVTKIDDDLLSSVTDNHDAWTALLSQPDVRKATEESEDGWLGWCVDRRWFVDQPAACCSPETASRNATACFVAYPPLALERCVDPVPYLGDSVEAPIHMRCASAVECSADHVCVRPRDDQALLRLTVHLPAWVTPNAHTSDTTVVWNGPRAEILEEGTTDIHPIVGVTTYAPRLRLLPLALPGLLSALTSYFSALNLSLFLFNLLPLSFLDGAPCVSAFFDIAVLAVSGPASAASLGPAPGDVELGALEGGGSPFERWHMRFDVRARWKRRLERGLHLLSAGLVGVCMLLGMIVGLGG
ncbi:uncharacterized protein C8Q71DRAFT_843079 [Rhodofomes roseus]|uniref:Endopeptidase S2P n=1 Tax=Rhodofomes roseus TaxID=34475 RepID=A0ABQ8K1V6_9APHY|nr:uncharacterized protein C8Q71DRAFT_843079 [Rhodofomes roseus]KAH9830175.1 hypothetical protein C8Q71DRAFT_843079 [Rhodofomes roseus]